MKKLAEKKHGTGGVPDPVDKRDLEADVILQASDEVDWEKGYDVEKELDITLLFKDQGSTGSCNGQGWAYYIAVLNAIETGVYDEASAKAFYSQIFINQPSGGSYVRDGAKLAVNWGALLEKIVSSYVTFTTQDINGTRLITNPPTEEFIRDLSWKTPEMDKLAKNLQAKEYRRINGIRTMDLFAKAIRDNHGVVSGLYGENNGTWRGLEPKPPVNRKWGHLIYLGKFGTDEKGKYIATPNSWGKRKGDALHPDGWQKLREDYFKSGNMFSPWTLTDKPNKDNQENMPKTLTKIFNEENSKRIWVSQEATSEDALYAMMRNAGLQPPMINGKANTIDWDKMNYDGMVGDIKFVAREEYKPVASINWIEKLINLFK